MHNIWNSWVSLLILEHSFLGYRVSTFCAFRINLYELIKKNNYQGFSIHLVRRFAYSILQCMRVMFKENIIHCDMKPENILLRQKGSSAIKVIDFGSGCFESQRSTLTNNQEPTRVYFIFILMEHSLGRGIKNGPKIKIDWYFFVEIAK